MPQIISAKYGRKSGKNAFRNAGYYSIMVYKLRLREVENPCVYNIITSVSQDFSSGKSGSFITQKRIV